MNYQPRKIVLFRQSRIGDTLVTFPVIEALHALYPDTSLIYCTQNFRLKKGMQGHQAVRLSPYINEIVTYDFENSVAQKYLELKSKLKVGKNDLLVYLPYSTVQRRQVLRDWIFFKALGFKNLLCFKQTWDWTYLYEKKKGELPKESDRIFGLLQSAGIPVEPTGTCLLNYDEDWAEKKWNEWGLNGKKVLAICYGSTMPSKLWPIERYIEVGCTWHKRTGMSIAVIGGPEEAKIANDVIGHWPGYGFSICGTTLRQTAAVLLRTRAYCGNDTGLMHLAAILGIPCVAIFSAFEPPKLWYPLGENNTVLIDDIDCKNCSLRNCHTTPPLCLNKITVEMVLEALASTHDNIQ